MGHEEAEIVNNRLGRSACLRPKKPKQLRNVVLLDGVAGAGITCVYIFIYIYIYIYINKSEQHNKHECTNYYET